MRVIERKRPPFMTRRKWVVLAILFIAAVITVISIAYRNIYSELWQQEKEMLEVIEQTELYSLSDEYQLNKYVWDNRYWILLANNAENQKIYSVWNEQEQLAQLSYEEALTKDEMREKIMAAKPELTSISLQPAYFYGEIAWEIQYRDPITTHIKLAFYTMRSGQFIDEYTIPKETRP